VSKKKGPRAPVDVAEYLDETIGVRTTSRGESGMQCVCECPFCGKDRKLYVHRETGLFICYSCGEGGGLTALVMAVEGCTGREARRILADAAGSRVAASLSKIRKAAGRRVAPATPATPPAEPQGAALPAEFLPIWDPDLGWRKVEYLEKRRIKYRTAMAMRLGVCIAGQYGGRLIFPIIEDGVVRSFAGRAMGGWEPKYQHPAADGKSSLLYGLDLVAGPEDVIVVEGPTDVLSMYQKRLPACALLGKRGTMAQAGKLHRRGARRVTLLLDGNAGADVLKTAAIFSETMEVLVAQLPGKLDPDEAPREVIMEALDRARPPSTLEMKVARRTL